MAREFGRWFRFYDSVLDDPKVQRLSDPLFRAWVNLMCVASRNAGHISANFKDIAFSLRVSEAKAKEIIGALVYGGLVDKNETDFTPHNWDGRQFQSDVSTPRVKRFRERRGNVSGNGNVTPSETPPETEADTEQNRAERERASAPLPQTSTRSAWPEGKEVPASWLKTAEGEIKRLGLVLPDLKAAAAKFAVHFAANPQPRTDTEWQARFITWVIDEGKRPNAGAQGQSGKPSISLAARVFREPAAAE